MKNHTVIRMCVYCKLRTKQEELLRFTLKDGAASPSDGSGRSAYLCKDCFKADSTKLQKALLRALVKTGRKISGKS